MMTQAVIYTRFSPRPNAQECESSEKQEERCRAHCDRRDLQIMCVFDDPEVSGGVLDRPGLSAALDAIQEIVSRSDPGVARVILVVDSADRLARDMLVSLTIRHEIEKMGASIEYANGTANNSTPEGRLFANILAAFASYERDRIRVATSRGMKRRQEAGEWFGKPPAGWMLDSKCSTRLVKCSQEQDALREAKRLSYMDSWSWPGIASYMNEKFGLFRGGPWKADTIRKALAKEGSNAHQDKEIIE